MGDVSSYYLMLEADGTNPNAQDLKELVSSLDDVANNTGTLSDVYTLIKKHMGRPRDSFDRKTTSLFQSIFKHSRKKTPRLTTLPALDTLKYMSLLANGGQQATAKMIVFDSNPPNPWK